MTANALAAGLESQPAMRNLCLGVISGMALQAKLAAFPAHQQHAVGTAVRIVARDAALDLYSRMFEHKRPALLHVALDASFRSGIVQAGHIPRAMRVVAVRALQQTFRNTMMLRLRKLRLNGLMAGVAQRGLG